MSEITKAKTADQRPIPRISEHVKGYQHPRTIAEMIPVRRAEIAAHAHEPHNCPHGHGPMPARAPERQTYEQLWCGVWYDCQHQASTHRCGGGQFYPSRDLAYEHGEPYNTGHGFEKFTPAGWVTISDEDAAAYWADRQAWSDERDRQRFTTARRRTRKTV